MNERLVQKTIHILRETKAQFKKVGVLWSTGKDSTAMLSLIKEAFFGEIPFPVIHIDTNWKFPEIYEFRDSLAKEWNMNLQVWKHHEAETTNPIFGVKHSDCCFKLKTTMLRDLIESNRFDAVIVSIRRDEHHMRNVERYSSPRDKDFKWHILRKKENPSEGDSIYEVMQPVELWDSIRTDFGENTHHVRVHPILHWSEVDVWEYVKDRNLPVNPLYFSRGGLRYRSLGCMPCTLPIKSDASSIDEIVEELKTTKTSERAGRAQDKEAEMGALRYLGYP